MKRGIMKIFKNLFKRAEVKKIEVYFRFYIHISFDHNLYNEKRLYLLTKRHFGYQRLDVFKPYKTQDGKVLFVVGVYRVTEQEQLFYYDSIRAAFSEYDILFDVVVAE